VLTIPLEIDSVTLRIRRVGTSPARGLAPVLANYHRQSKFMTLSPTLEPIWDGYRRRWDEEAENGDEM